MGILKKNYPRQRKMNENGSSSVEFALIAGVFFMFLFGIIEYGWVMTQQLLLSHAVGEGARAAITIPVETSDAKCEVAVRKAAKKAFSVVGTIEDGDISVEIREPQLFMGQTLPRRVFVEVASWTYTPLVGYLPASAVPRSLSATALFLFP